MPSSAAARSAAPGSREAMATTSQRAERCIAGITLRVAIAAHPSTPQRTGAGPFTTPPGGPRRPPRTSAAAAAPGPGSTTSPSPSRQRSATSAGSSPEATAAACTHAPAATCSSSRGTSTARPLRSASTCRKARERAPPPMSSRRPSAGAKAVERVEPVEQPADDPLDAGPGELLAADVAADPRQHAGRRRSVGRPLAVEVREQREAAGPRPGGEREVVERAVVDAEQPAHGLRDLRRVERAHEREVAAGGIGEPGDDARRIGDRLVADREHGARRPDRHGDVARCAARRRAPPPCCRRCRERRPRRATRRRRRRARAPPAPPPTSPGRRRRRRAGRGGTRPRPPTSSRCRTRRRGR